MNYLAHIFLSGSDGKLQLGNFIGDAVKGSAYNSYPQAIADGVLLHRAIDAYTDSQPAVREAVKALKPHFGRYSGALLDIFFDHLLAARFDEFSDIPLRKFARRFYLTMIRNRRWLPDRIKRFMWHFIGTNRLCKYAKKEGIRESLDIMVRVNRIKISVDDAIAFMGENEEWLFETLKPLMAGLQELCGGYITAEDRKEYLKRLRIGKED